MQSSEAHDSNQLKGSKTKRGDGLEAQRTACRMKSFKKDDSEFYKMLSNKFSSGITHSELVSVASVCCYYTDLKLDRGAKRVNEVLIKWFDENWNVLKDVIDRVTLRDEKEIPINLELENKEKKKT